VMRTLRPPSIVLGVLCVGFLVWITCSAAWLPERVAVHFGSGGEANGWMTRSAHLLFIGALGVGVPLLFAGLVLLIGWIPAQFINVPRRDYWLAPEREAETRGLISRGLLWLGCLMVVFFSGIQLLLVQANLVAPAHWPMQWGLPVTGGFLVGVGLWLAYFIGCFAKER
jgi:hypothetical protein